MNTVTKQEITRQAAGRTPASEATKIEQSRAIAQVQGALVVARQNPRDTIGATNRMREACAITALAERAFFRYSRGGSQITGPSIHLATELARCWGNVDYGIQELSRNDVKGESEMQAFAWDLETNARVFNTFIVPHLRDKKGGPVALTDMRDIYENNANNGARRLRECIFRILPVAYVEEAKQLCSETLQHGGGVPLLERREKMLSAFAAMGVNRKMVEQKIGRVADQLTALDLGALQVIYGSLKRGETTIDDEFQRDETEAITKELREKTKGQTLEGAPAKEPPPDGQTANQPSDGVAAAVESDPITDGGSSSSAGDAPAAASLPPEEGASEPLMVRVPFNDDGQPLWKDWFVTMAERVAALPADQVDAFMGANQPPMKNAIAQLGEEATAPWVQRLQSVAAERKGGAE
ncbi:MAG: hypothetical protein ACPGO3_15685 [Magnetospiraceae bacterium]